jgi:hypothetical protein
MSQYRHICALSVLEANSYAESWIEHAWTTTKHTFHGETKSK